MLMRLLAVVVVLVAAGAAASGARSTAPPVGPLPKGPEATVKRAAGSTFTIALPKPAVAGRSWRVARAYDSHVVHEVREHTTKTGATLVTYRAIAPGTTRVVYALTRGEERHAYATRTFHVRVTTAASRAGCPDGLLALSSNPIGPAAAAALAADPPKNRPQVTAAAIASRDSGRGEQVKAECGAHVQARTVVVYITDRALLPAQSVSQRILFVGRTSSGYHVWERLK